MSCRVKGVLNDRNLSLGEEILFDLIYSKFARKMDDNLLYYVASVLDPRIKSSLIVSQMCEQDADEEWVLKWWRANEFNFPLMAKAARYYLAIPSAEVDIEREFSNARDVLGLRRHCLNAETMQWLMLLKEQYSA